MSDKTIQNTTVGTVQPGALTAIARKEDFLQHLQDFLDTHKTEKWCVAAIDVEHFRLYNELYGTEQGDTLLNTLASHLLDYQKTSGCPVGYWGNDDFFLCLPDDRVQQQDIVITLQTCVSPNHQDVTFFLALGLCPVSEHPEADAATLCNYAQIAVMNPDHSGSGIHRFAPAMLDSLKAQQQLLSELEHALDNHEFTFFLQPKCNSMTRAIVGMEALVRWNHPTRGCVHPDDAEMFQEQVDLPLLQDTLFHSQQPEFYRFRKQIANQFVWITMEVLPCRGCCAQNPWATVLMREDAQANQLSEELDFSYSHDTLTGLANRSKYESDLRELQYSDYDSMVCTYIDVVGLHEVNDHLGHRSGDNLLCTIANAARKFFVSSRIYRVGGDEFVVLTPNLPPYDVWTASDRMRVFLREKDCEISVGIQNTNNLRKLEAAVNKAEQAMQQDKLAYYGRNGQERQLKGLNEKLERTLTQKRDAEHFLRVLAPKYRSVYVVNLQEDSARPIIIPDFFQKILDTSGGSFRAVITAYRDQYVVPESRDAFNSVLDYSFVRSKVLSGEIVEVHYTRTDGAPYTLKITPYSSSGSHIHETIWIFADDTATLTPPQRKLKNNRNSVK